ERLGPPEAADREAAGGLAEVVEVAVTQHEAAVDEPLLVGLQRRDEPRVARVDQPDRRQQQVRRVGVLAAERLREEPEPLVEAARDDLLALARCDRLPLLREVAPPE